MATATSATLYKSAPSVPGREPERARRPGSAAVSGVLFLVRQRVRSSSGASLQRSPRALASTPAARAAPGPRTGAPRARPALPPRAPHAVLNEAEALAGKRAALFFSAGWCPQCTNLVQLTLTLDTEHVPKRLLPSISTTAPPNPEPRHVEASRGSRAAGHTTALTCGHDSEAACLCALRCAFAASRWAYSTFCQPRQERGGGRGRAGSRVDWRTVGGRLGKLGALRSAPFELPWP